LTFQQVQKYERGTNRIGASRWHELSQVLDVPVSFFFDDIDPVRVPAMGGFAEQPAGAFDSTHYASWRRWNSFGLFSRSISQ
jgi:hypothetical protein